MVRACACLLAALLPLAGSAQPLPQSTLDRQAIATLQWRLQQPGLSELDRLEIERRITELRYRIAISPPIAPQPTLPPLVPPAFGAHPRPMATIAPGTAAPEDAASHCDTLRVVITYLNALRSDGTVSEAERAYTTKRIAKLQREARAWKCPSTAGN